MAEIVTGIYKALGNPRIYDTFESLIGSKRLRQRLVKEFIKPFPGARLIDVGCGTASILEYLPRDIKYLGFDPKKEYIDRAKQRYGNKGEFICTDVAGFVNNYTRYSNHFDIAIAISLLHHLEDAEAKRVFSIAKDVLVENGRLVTSDSFIAKDQNIMARLIILMDRGQNVRTAEEYLKIANPIFKDVDSHKITDSLRIPYSHFIMSCSK